MAYEEDTKSEWNFDGAELEAIFLLKSNFIIQMSGWDLEKAFWTARTLRMELDAKLSRGKKKMRMQVEEMEGEKKEKEKAETEKELVDRLLNELEDHRNTYNGGDTNSDKVRTTFFSALEGFYLEICYLMKKHGLYFREKEYGGLAVTKG